MRNRNLSTKRFLQELSYINQTVPVIVEGLRDVEALRSLGLKGCIVKVHSGRSIQQFCDEFSELHGEAVILTDWDLRGNQLFGLLTKYLEANWERHNHFREELRELAGSAFREVEKMKVWEHFVLATGHEHTYS